MDSPTKIAALALFLALTSVLPGCSDSIPVPGLEGLENVEQLTASRELNQQKETLGIAKSSYLQLIEHGVRVRNELEDLRRLQSQWDSQVIALLANEDGRFIASDAEDVSTFREHFESMETVSEESLEKFGAELDALIAPLQSALDAGEIVGHPDEKFAPKLDALGERIRQTAAPYKRTIPAIESIVANAKRRGANGSQSLGEEMEELTLAEARTRGAQLEAARKVADDEVTKQLAGATQALILAKGERERKKLEAETALENAEADAETLKAKATNPDTMRRLEPFVTKGNSILLPNDRMYEWRRIETEPLPLSFKAISLQGALEPTEKGLKNLMRIVTDYNNGRPAWPQPSAKEDWDWIRENQKLLKDLGPTLVSLGHLAP
jgi:hypothetical protein